jgi:hypothetical protein
MSLSMLSHTVCIGLNLMLMMSFAQAQITAMPLSGTYQVDHSNRSTISSGNAPSVHETTVDGKTGKQVVVITSGGKTVNQYEVPGHGPVKRCWGTSGQPSGQHVCPATTTSHAPGQARVRFECSPNQTALNIKFAPAARPNDWVLTYTVKHTPPNGAGSASMQGNEIANAMRVLEQAGAGGARMSAEERKKWEELNKKAAVESKKTADLMQRQMANASPQERAQMEAAMKSMPGGGAPAEALGKV